MTDPRRLLDDPTLDEGARAVLRAARQQRGNAAQRDAIWAAIAAGLPSVPQGGDLSGGPDPTPLDPSITGLGVKTAVTGPGATLGAKALGWLGFVKAGAFGAGVMSAVLGAQILLSSPPEVPRPVPALSIPRSTQESVTQPQEPLRVETSSAPIPSAPLEASRKILGTSNLLRPTTSEVPPTSAEPSGQAILSAPNEPAVPSPAESSTSMVVKETLEQAREEARLVREADQALRRGDAGSALKTLEELRQRFPGGVLGQEREVLTIEALSRSGQGAQASARAEAFLVRNPASPFAERVRLLVQNKKGE
ncbi:MAG: outer membrane protein assembly factor BamD [Myxococcales bacterium]|nr:outer membrane protein assembly factor BamD [Polyangiaceae bacterium]MDW8250190.1 outer membrane protein assembly factor BamD [Myxococcales bacterium]